jgi:arsenate reductase
MKMQDLINVLFVCSDNATRGPMAQVLLDRLGPPRFAAFSAGLQVHEGLPLDARTVEALREAGFTNFGIKRKQWREFCKPTAPRIDLVVTLGDEAASESFSDLPGQPTVAHWTQLDPLQADPGHMEAPLRAALHDIQRHIDLLVNLPPEAVERLVRESASNRVT